MHRSDYLLGRERTPSTEAEVSLSPEATSHSATLSLKIGKRMLPTELPVPAVVLRLAS